MKKNTSHSSVSSSSDSSLPNSALSDSALSDSTVVDSSRRDDTSSLESNDLDKLRQLLLGSAIEELVSPEAISKVLPEAMSRSFKEDTLTPAVVPVIERAIQASVERDSLALSDSLFPVIGPATRKSISSAIGNLIQSLNQTLEYSLSPRSFKWRIEAFRTGKTFAEVVLLRTLVYQVEQVFLIHKESGLVMQHIMADTATVQDPDLVAAMLTALQDFVKDSFVVDGSEALNALELGDFTLWIEEGPQAVLACVIRGNAPQSFRTQLRQTQEKIHLLFKRALTSFDGNPETLNGSRSYLEECFQAQFKNESTDKQEKKPPLSRGKKAVAWLLLTAIVVGMSVWIYLNHQVQQRWEHYVTSLSEQPGLVVISHQRVPKGPSGWPVRWPTLKKHYVIYGLKDPLAIDPADLLEAANLTTDQVKMNWEPYFSLRPELTAQRIETLLAPPPTVELTVDKQRVLHAAGRAPRQWIEMAKQLSTQLYGISAWEDKQLVATELYNVELKSLEGFKSRFTSQ